MLNLLQHQVRSLINHHQGEEVLLELWRVRRRLERVMIMMEENWRIYLVGKERNWLSSREVSLPLV